MVRVARIVIFPFKSFDGLEVDEVHVLPSGGLEHDRRFALITADGRAVNGKRTERVHPLVISYDRRTRSVDLSRRDRPTDPVKFHLDADRDELELWLSEYFETPVTIVENADSGFPDDTVASGPTFIATETLSTVASWFAEMTLDEVRRRFRANIELEGEEIGPVGSPAAMNGSNVAVLGGSIVRRSGRSRPIPCRRGLLRGDEPVRPLRGADAGFVLGKVQCGVQGDLQVPARSDAASLGGSQSIRSLLSAGSQHAPGPSIDRHDNPHWGSRRHPRDAAAMNAVASETLIPERKWDWTESKSAGSPQD